MVINVRMLRSGPGVVRPVYIPEKAINDGHLLDLVYYYGQNDYCKGPEKNKFYSVSIGDVIDLPNGESYRVAHGFGYEKL